MNIPPPLPVGPPLNLPWVTVTCTVIWPDHTRVTAMVNAHFSNEDGEVSWNGATHKLLEAHPVRTDACALAAWLEDQAERTGGTFSQTQDGDWPIPDEVKA
jgi:hypothetical protein